MTERAAGPGPVILVVEDNPLTRRMTRAALESEGWSVLEAEDGTGALRMAKERLPDLVVQDLVLPDMDGEELLRRIRGLPGGQALPVVILSGLASRVEEMAAAHENAVTHHLAKPVEPSRLAAVVRRQLGQKPRRPGRAATGPLVLVVDREPAERRLADLWLLREGFLVAPVERGDAALRAIRQLAPAAVVADVLAPGLDGFELCRALRKDRDLSRLPVVLLASAYAEEQEARLARAAGAHALVPRTPGLSEAAAALRGALAGAPAPPLDEETFLREHERWLRAQLEGSLADYDVLARRSALQASALSLLSGISHGLGQPEDMSRALGDVLSHCLDAAGLPAGLCYLVEPGRRLRLRTRAGLSQAAVADAEGFFGHLDFLWSILEQGVPVALTSSGPQPAVEVLTWLDQRSALLVPFRMEAEPFGVIVLASEREELGEEVWLNLGRSLSLQFGQSVALGQSIARLASSEKRLRESEQEYRLLFEGNPQPMWVFDEETLRFLAVNDAAVRHYGYTREEFLRMTILDIRPPEEAQRVREAMTIPISAGDPAARGTWRHRKKDGTVIEVEVTRAPIAFRGRRARLTMAMDVTEKRALQEQLLQAQKIESLGRLAGGVAHDFNNIINVITGYAGLMMRRLPEGDPLRRFPDEILKAAERGASLTGQLLAFSRRQVLQPRVLDLNAVLRDLTRMLPRLIGEDIDVRTVLGPSVGRVRADPGQVEQVVMNLATNARDAMPRGGKLTLETADVEMDDVFVRAHLGAQPGRYVMLAVSDTGVGMDAATQARIFEPFFTTKEKGKGTGLGLSTVYGIVKQSGGYIGVYSEPGRGSTFKIFLPRVEDPPSMPGPQAPEGGYPQGTETLLLVEDEPALRDIVRECLEEAGYTVLEAKDGAEAVRLADEHLGPLHLLLTDVVMPSMSGRELAEHLAAKRPDMRVLYLSGYTDDAVVHHGVLTEQMAFLQKPFTAAALARKVRQVLDAPPFGTS